MLETTISSRSKKCWSCGGVKKLSSFRRRQRSRDGRDDRCAKCALVYEARYREKNREKIRAYQRTFHKEHARERDARVKKWLVENKQRRKDWDKKNAQHHRELYRTWYKKNSQRVVARKAIRRAMKLKATPPWVRIDDFITIYEQCKSLSKRTGKNFQVDHIWPLKGDNFCGLHVPWNLQILTSELNQSKKNKRPDAPELAFVN